MKSKKISIFKIISFVVLLLYVLSMFMLLVWALNTSLKLSDDYADNLLGLPNPFAFSNYVEVFNSFAALSEGPNSLSEYVYVETMLLNSLLYAGVTGFFAAVVPMVTAYATAKYDFKFNKVVHFIVIFTMVMPIVGAYPSELDLLSKLGLYDKFFGPWIQKSTFTTLYFLVFYATFGGISKEFCEAAYVDGASEFRLMTQIMFPLAKNVFFTIYLIMFITFWNDYQAPALYIPSFPTLSYGVYYVCLRDTRGIFNFIPGQMTVCILVALPILVLFIVFKNKLLGNLTMGGVKG